MDDDLGDLNPRTLPQRPRELTDDISAIKYLRDSTVSMAQPRIRIFGHKGALARCIQVFNSAEDQKQGKAKSGFNMWNLFKTESDTNVVTIRACLLNIHSAIELPPYSRLPLNPEHSSYLTDLKIVEAYPKFVGVEPDLPIPKVGQLIWVDFEDREGLSGPLYIGPVDPNEVPSKILGDPCPKDAKYNGPRDAFTPSARQNIKKTMIPVSPITISELEDEFDHGHDHEDSSGDANQTPDFILETDSVITLKENVPYRENRVRAGVYGSLPPTSHLAVKFSNTKVHKLFAVRLEAMNKAWVASGEGRSPFKSSSGIRPGPESRYAWLKQPSSWKFKRFARSTTSSKPHVKHGAKNLKAALQRGETSLYKLWIEMLLDEYAGDLKLGKERRAWNSPHTSGLAIDFNNNGLVPSTKKRSIKDQQETDAFKWLKANAYKFGINPYKKEPWHWECLIPRENFFSGEEFISSTTSKNKYNIRVVEKSKKGRKRATSHYYFAKNAFT